MSLLTIAQAQALGVGLALSDADLQTVIDREEAELVRLFGAVYTGAAISETAHGGGKSIYLKRAAASISSIVEYLYPGDTAPTTLTAQDYCLWPSEGRVERLPWGVSSAVHWGTPIVVSYIPTDDRDLWRSVIADLVRIATEQASSGGGTSVSGLGFSVGASSASSTAGTGWEAQRGAAYARIGWLSR